MISLKLRNSIKKTHGSIRFMGLVFLFIYMGMQTVSAQSTDTLQKPHSPRKATIYSAILPGAGQVYNKKYWKVPLIYASYGTLTYFFLENRKQFRFYRDNYNALTDNDTNTVSEFPISSLDALIRVQTSYRRNMELTVILGGVLYLLNIVDATVDAHLFDFDVSKDLSLNWQPTFQLLPATNSISPGISLRLKL